MVTALWLDRIRSWALAVIAAGGRVDLDDMHQQFDTWLISEPEVIDADQAELMSVLGVGRWSR